MFEDEDEYVLPAGYVERNAKRAELAVKRSETLASRRAQAAKLVAGEPHESRSTLRAEVRDLSHAQVLFRDEHAVPGSMEFISAATRDAEKRVLLEALGRVVAKIDPPYLNKIFQPDFAYVIARGKVPAIVAQGTHLQLGSYDSIVDQTNGNDQVGINPEAHDQDVHQMMEIVERVYEREARRVRAEAWPSKKRLDLQAASRFWMIKAQDGDVSVVIDDSMTNKVRKDRQIMSGDHLAEWTNVSMDSPRWQEDLSVDLLQSGGLSYDQAVGATFQHHSHGGSFLPLIKTVANRFEHGEANVAMISGTELSLWIEENEHPLTDAYPTHAVSKVRARIEPWAPAHIPETISLSVPSSSLGRGLDS